MTAKLKHILRRPWLRIAGSLLILSVLLAFLPLHKLVAALRVIPVSLWACVLLAFLATHLLGAVKWRLTLRLSDARLSFAQAIRCYFAGVFGTLFLPSIVGGDVVRMGVAFGVQRNRAAVVLGSLVDRLLDMVALAVVAGAGVVLLPGALDQRHRRAFMVLAALFAIAFAALLGLLIFMPWQRLPYKLRRISVKLRRAARSMASRPQYVLVSFTSRRPDSDQPVDPFAGLGRCLRSAHRFSRLVAGLAAGQTARSGAADIGWAGRP